MILEQIKNPDFFNNSEQNMIYFLQNNLNSFDQVTLNKMAKESFSSTSSVLRFCKKLGFDGFKDFKLQLIREASISGQDLNFNLPFSPDDSVEDIGLHLSEILANGIKKNMQGIDKGKCAAELRTISNQIMVKQRKLKNVKTKKDISAFGGGGGGSR